MNILLLLITFLFLSSLSYTLPTQMDSVPIIHLIENSITAYHNKVVVIPDFKGSDIWFGNYHLWVSFILYHFCLYISKSPGHWKSPWEYSMWPQNYLLNDFSSNILRNGTWVLINFSTVLLYSFHFYFFCWFMVSW